MFIVVYRPHNRLHCETQYVGPFASFDDAYNALCAMPALGIHIPDGCTRDSGVKFVQELQPELSPCA